MAFRISVSAALVAVLMLSGCMTTQKSSGLANPFAKGDFSASQKKKKPLTQVAMEALKPKKTPVRIVSPRDWFRGTSTAEEAASQVTSEQLSELAAQYRAAAQKAAAQQTANNSAPVQTAAVQGGVSPMAVNSQAVSPLLSFDNTSASTAPSQTAMPTFPQHQVAQFEAMQSMAAQQATPSFPAIRSVSQLGSSVANAANTQMQQQAPQVQFQAARLPLGQPVANVQQAAAQAAVPASKRVASPSSFAPAAMAPSAVPNGQWQTPATSPPSQASPVTSYPNAETASVQTGYAYPTTPQQSLPRIPAAPLYR